jgi:hypothetical protein
VSREGQFGIRQGGDDDCGISTMMDGVYTLGTKIRRLGNGESTHEIVISVIPSDFACSYINPSTSDETAEVHSSRIAYDGRW